MQIGAVGYPSYIYNTNSVSAASMNRINGIPEDALESSVDYKSNTALAKNENSLRPGESRNFMDILSSQMEMGRANAARIMQEDPFAAEETAVDAVAEVMADMAAEGDMQIQTGGRQDAGINMEIMTA